MSEVRITGKQLNEIREIVGSLRESGLQQGTDFDFAYHPSIQYHSRGYGKLGHTIFKFYDSKLASWFSLKWS